VEKRIQNTSSTEQNDQVKPIRPGNAQVPPAIFLLVAQTFYNQTLQTRSTSIYTPSLPNLKTRYVSSNSSFTTQATNSITTSAFDSHADSTKESAVEELQIPVVDNIYCKALPNVLILHLNVDYDDWKSFSNDNSVTVKLEQHANEQNIAKVEGELICKNCAEFTAKNTIVIRMPSNIAAGRSVII
jgi:hypothetical protein